MGKLFEPFHRERAQQKGRSRAWGQRGLFKWIGVLSLGLMAIALYPAPAQSAERIIMIYGPFKFTLSIKSLEAYATEGKIDQEFAFYARRFDQQKLTQLRQTLQRRYTMTSVEMYRMMQVPMVQDFLHGLGQVINVPGGDNGFYAIESALLLTPRNRKDWTMVDVMRQFPTDIEINTARAFKLLNSSPPSDTTACDASGGLFH
jgi:hypothetical protein